MKIQTIVRRMALVTLTALMGTTAVAQQVTVSQIPGYHAGDGEFNVSPIIGGGYDASVLVGNGFETFCVSRNAYLPILPDQYFGSVDINGIHQPENVVITKGMAWLYSEFAAGTLVGYNYADTVGSGRTESAYQLQLAIWILEGQYPIDSIVDGSDPFLNEAIAFFGGGAAGLIIAMSPNTPGDYNVGVLNLNVINDDGSIGAVAQPVLMLLPPLTNSIGTGDTATIGFWHNKNGQALIKSMPKSPALGNWLASSFPCLYGANAGANNLTGKSDSTVAALFLTFFNKTGAKTDAQILGAALACYVTSSTLSGTTCASKYGFNVSPGGIGSKTYNVGPYGTAIGLSNNTDYTVLQLLQQANLMKCEGTFNANAFNSIFDGINTTGDII